MADYEDFTSGQNLEGWGMDKGGEWREPYSSNDEEKHEEYFRLWRGIWDGSDTLREAERSKLIAPALKQEEESEVDEVEEETFVHGQ